MPPAARQGDTVVGTDTHVVMVPAPPGAAVPTPAPHPFAGPLMEGLVADVLIADRPAAIVGSVAHCLPPHVPVPPTGPFQRPPSNRGTVQAGSPTVLIGGKPAARVGDPVRTCNDPVDLPTSRITSGEPSVVIA